jgi:hypothetical protein
MYASVAESRTRCQVGDLAPVEFGNDGRGRLIGTTQSDGVTARSIVDQSEGHESVGDRAVADDLARE